MLELSEAGCSQRFLAIILTVRLSSIQIVLEWYQETGQLTRRPGSGRNSTSSDRDARSIYCLEKQHPIPVDDENRLMEVLNINDSQWKVRNSLLKLIY